MKNAFLYEYIRYIKDDLKYFEKEENKVQVNGIKTIICNDSFENINNDYIMQEESWKKLYGIVESMNDMNKKKSNQNVEEKKIFRNFQKETSALLKEHGTSLMRVKQYLSHYEAILKNWDCSFAVVFDNNEIWSVNYTRSLRKDRIDTHIARFNYLHSDKNYLVVSDYQMQDEQSMLLIKALKNNPSAYGTPVFVVSFEELLDQLMANIFRYKRKDGILCKVPSKTEMSIINGIRGVEIENIYSKCLSNDKNYKCYIENILSRIAEETDGTFLPAEYKYIVDKILSDKHILKSDVDRIESINIGELKLKPDVYICIYLKDNSKVEVGVSIKSSGEENVSFHEKKAEDFIRVLDIHDIDIKNALIHFQEVRAVKNLTVIEQKVLTEYFSEEANKRRLVTWVVTGEDSDKYRANYVLSHHYGNDVDTMGISIISSEEYIEEIMERSDSKTFNSGFSWTYKGVIQLKGPVL